MQKPITVEEVMACYESGEHVLGTATKWDPHSLELTVMLGSITVHVPFDEISTYHIKLSDDPEIPILPTPIDYILGQKIGIHITHISDTNCVYGSHKDHIISEFEKIKEGEVYRARIVKVLSDTIYVSINGVIGYSCQKEATSFRGDFKNRFSIGKTIPVTILKKTNVNTHLKVSYRNCFSTRVADYRAGTFTTCIVDQALENDVGTNFSYFVELAPGVSGIMKSPYVLTIGETVLGEVYRITPSGPKLYYRHKINN